MPKKNCKAGNKNSMMWRRSSSKPNTRKSDWKAKFSDGSEAGDTPILYPYRNVGKLFERADYSDGRGYDGSCGFYFSLISGSKVAVPVAGEPKGN